MKRPAVIASVVTAVVFAMFASTRLDSRSRLVGEQSGWTTPTIPLVDALRSGGLPAAAALVGHYVAGEENDADFMALDCFDLANRSSAVVLGRVTGKLQAQMYGSRAIYTDHVVEVIEHYKGSVGVGSQLKVKMPGGLVQFANGTTAEWREARNPFLAVNSEYVFFVNPDQDESGVYIPTLGPQGVFGFTADGKVISRARRVDEVFRKYDGINRLTFLAQLRTVS